MFLQILDKGTISRRKKIALFIYLVINVRDSDVLYDITIHTKGCRHADIAYEPRHDKTNKVTVPSEDSDQPGHPPSLIRVLAVRMRKACP